MKAIFCDIGNVLLFFDLFKSIRRYLAMGKRSVRKILPIIFNTSFIHDFEVGKVSAHEFYRGACDLFGMRLSFEEFCSIWNDMFLENVPMTRWLKEMSASHRIYLISNTNSIHYEHIRKHYDFCKYVSGDAISCQLGIRKPDPRIFYHALQKACVKPSQSFYLDDVWGHVHAARQCGMHAVHYSSPAEALEAWRQFLYRM